VYLSQSLKFVKPVRRATRSRAGGRARVLTERNRVRLQTVCVNQRGENPLGRGVGDAVQGPRRLRGAAAAGGADARAVAMAAQAARLWAALVTSAVRR